MRKLPALVLTFFALAFVSCSDNTSSPTEPSAPLTKTIQQKDVPWGPFVLHNTCCDEDVTMSGSLHYVMKDGKSSLNGSQVTGTTTDGRTYHGNINLSSSESLNEDGSGCYSTIENFTATAAGGCRMKLRLRVRACVDATGNWTFSQQVENYDCF